MKPEISILIFVRGEESSLTRTLESVLNSTLRDLEVILVGSSLGRIFEKNRKKENCFSDPRLIPLSSEKNLSRLEAWMEGMGKASGKWITFVDPGDSVSVDRFRLLMQEGERQNADMVWGDCLFSCKRKNCYPVFSELRNRLEPLSTPLPAEKFFARPLPDGEWHGVWSKIYRRDLMEQALAALRKTQMPLTDCGDIAFSTALFLPVKKMVFAHGADYYRSEINETEEPLTSAEDARRSLAGMQAAFHLAEKILREFQAGNHAPQLQELKLQMLGSLRNRIRKNFDFPPARNSILREMEEASVPLLPQEADQKYQRSLHLKKMEAAKTGLEEIRTAILNPDVKVVSFDIFDTLLLRPFYTPSDLFFLLGMDFFRKYSISPNFIFKELRMLAEKTARRKNRFQEPDIHAIYREFKSLSGFTEEQTEYCKNREIELEKQYCTCRQSGALLYQTAVAAGKKIIASSDMYLPSDVLRDLLIRCGYSAVQEIFVSCETQAGKGRGGKMYDFICKKLSVPPRNILHIGDNPESDVIQARKRGVHAALLPRAVKQFETFFSRFFPPWTSPRMFLLEWIGIRCMIALAANKLFDNPFRNVPALFGGNPLVFGYFGLGTHLTAVTRWIQERVVKEHLTGIHFLYRDGFLAEQAYQLMYGNSPEAVPHNVWYLNRQTAGQIGLRQKTDLLSWISLRTSYRLSLDNLEAIYQNLLPDNVLREIRKKLSAVFPEDKIFNDREQTIFIKTARKHLDRLLPFLADYQKKLLGFLKKDLFGKNDATFDIGYSSRNECILAESGIPISCLYIHVNGDITATRALRGFQIHTFYPYTPPNNDIIREICFSVPAPKCIAFSFKDGKAAPVFAEKNEYDAVAVSIISLIQNHALDFVRDWKAVFQDRWNDLFFRAEDASCFFEYFLHFATPSDCAMLSGVPFENNLGGGSSNSAAEDWKRTSVGSSALKLPAISGSSLQLVKKVIQAWRVHGLAYVVRRVIEKIGQKVQIL